ncbi:YciI family protein [Aeoliella sp.]|uniref:YciI family protein n=1 Tax=Aeoliella sp. TaxID=2795800 RepID=UPI003CCC143E
MKYLLLIYGAEDSYTDQERAACMKESAELCHELSTKGQYLLSSPLHPVATATSVRVRDGQRQVTDGPFAETTEQLGGFYLIDMPNLDEAIAFAARIPPAKKGTVEIRPVLEIENLPTAPGEA